MSHIVQRWPLKAGRSGWLVATAICVVLLAALGFVDVAISQIGQGLPTPIVTLFQWITQLGVSDYILVSSLALFLAAGGVSLLVHRPQRRDGLRQLAGIGGYVFVGVGLPSLVTAIIKRLVGRSRPELYDTVGAFDFQSLSWLDWTYQSFPSGHATTAFALCYTVSFLAPRTFPAMLGLAVLIALSRIIVGAHYPSDVLGGAVVGTLGAYAVRNFFAARGWLFEFRPDGAVGIKPFDAVARIFSRS